MNDRNESEILQFERNELEKGTPVFLNIYSISCMNNLFQTFGFGLFHTGIQIKQLEYSFGSTKSETSGIIAIKPGSLKFKLKEKILLGLTLFSDEEISDISNHYSSFWSGNTYDPFLKNCNHFTLRFAEIILKSKISYPSYVNRFSALKTTFKCFFDPFRTLFGDAVKMSSSHVPRIKVDFNQKSEFNEIKLIEDPLDVQPNKKAEKLVEQANNTENQEKNWLFKEKSMKKKRRITNLKARMNRYRIKNENKCKSDNLTVNTQETIKLNHQDFFAKFNPNVLENFEKDFKERIQLTNCVRSFIDDTTNEGEQSLLINKSEFDFDSNKYSSFEEFIWVLNKKKRDIGLDPIRKKKYFAKNIIKYSKLASDLCFTKKDYNKALLLYKNSLELIDEFNLLTDSNEKNESYLIASDRSNIDENFKFNMIDRSLVMNAEMREILELQSFENKEFLEKLQLNILHCSIFCFQKLNIFNDIIIYCDRILEIDNNDWIAFIKRGFIYFIQHNFEKAEADFKSASQACPNEERYKLENLFASSKNEQD